MVPDGRTDGMDGRTDAAKTISLRLRRGIKKILFWKIFENLNFYRKWCNDLNTAYGLKRLNHFDSLLAG